MQKQQSLFRTRTGCLTGAVALLTAVSLSAIAQVPTTGLGLWLKADTGITLNGATVSGWADQSSTAQALQQPNAASQPRLSIRGPASRRSALTALTTSCRLTCPSMTRTAFPSFSWRTTIWSRRTVAPPTQILPPFSGTKQPVGDGCFSGPSKRMLTGGLHNDGRQQSSLHPPRLDR